MTHKNSFFHLTLCVILLLFSLLIRYKKSSLYTSAGSFGSSVKNANATLSDFAIHAYDEIYKA